MLTELRYKNFENIYVHDVYNKISSEFDVTRKYHWKSVKTFLDSLKKDVYGIDIGCGNGRNMLYRNDIKMVGIDKCSKLVDICKEKGLDVIEGDATRLPYKNNTFDFAMSIAVIHHLSNSKRRLSALNEMIRIIKPGGYGLLSVWSLEQPETSKKEFELGDNIVKWHSYNRESKQIEEFHRYYHICDKNDFINFIKKVEDKIMIIGIFNEMGNWYLKFKKTAFD